MAKKCPKSDCVHIADHPKGMCQFCTNFDEYFVGTEEEYFAHTTKEEEHLLQDVQSFIQTNICCEKTSENFKNGLKNQKSHLV